MGGSSRINHAPSTKLSALASSRLSVRKVELTDAVSEPRFRVLRLVKSALERRPDSRLNRAIFRKTRTARQIVLDIPTLGVGFIVFSRWCRYLGRFGRRHSATHPRFCAPALPRRVAPFTPSRRMLMPTVVGTRMD
jgi:hypothetical protein